MTCAIPAKDLAKRFLAKRFKETRAPGGVDPAARTGALLGLVGLVGLAGLLGPNGAGKTTTVRIFATLLRPEQRQRARGRS